MTKLLIRGYFLFWFAKFFLDVYVFKGSVLLEVLVLFFSGIVYGVLHFSDFRDWKNDRYGKEDRRLTLRKIERYMKLLTKYKLFNVRYDTGFREKSYKVEIDDKTRLDLIEREGFESNEYYVQIRVETHSGLQKIESKHNLKSGVVKNVPKSLNKHILKTLKSWDDDILEAKVLMKKKERKEKEKKRKKEALERLLREENINELYK